VQGVGLREDDLVLELRIVRLQASEQVGVEQVRRIPQAKEQADPAAAAFVEKMHQHGLYGRHASARRDHDDVALRMLVEHELTERPLDLQLIPRAQPMDIVGAVAT